MWDSRLEQWSSDSVVHQNYLGSSRKFQCLSPTPGDFDMVRVEVRTFQRDLNVQPGSTQSWSCGLEMIVKVAQSCLTLGNSVVYTVHGILQARYWSGQPFPSLWDLPNPGLEPRSPALQVDSLPGEPQGKLGNSQYLDWVFFPNRVPTQDLKPKYTLLMRYYSG